MEGGWAAPAAWPRRSASWRRCASRASHRSGDIYDEPVAIAPIAQRATQGGHMDRKVGRLPRIQRASQCRTLVEIAHRSLRVRQGVRDQSITRWRHHEVMAAGHDDQILLTILLIDDRRGLAAGGEHLPPQDLAGLDVDRLD